jgi:Uma2 family endonuclease
MHMATTARRWTLADLERMPDDGNRYELVRGELFVTPAPRRMHQEIVAALTDIIAPYVASHRLGRVHHPRAIIRIDGNEVEPDIMVRPHVPLPAPNWEDAPLPLLVVEVLSDTTKRRDQLAKRALYADIGIPDYWLVDADARAITVIHPTANDVIATEVLSWHPAGASQPLVIDVLAFFREILG